MNAINADTRRCALQEAKRWIGTPYQHQASLRDVGCDCLGLVRGVWRHLYGAEPYSVPAYSVHWAETGDAETLMLAARQYLEEIPADTAQAGDVLLFRFSAHHIAKHCVILSAPTRMVHAYWGQCVSETSLTPWWRKRIAAAFQFRN